MAPKTLHSILLTPLLLTPAFAGGSDTGSASDLDREIDRLLATQGNTGPGFHVGSLLRVSYDSSSDDVYAVDGENLGGFRFQDVQLWAEGSVDRFDVRIMAKAADSTAFPPTDSSAGSPGTFALSEAWARTRIDDTFSVLIGQYKCPLVASANVDYGSLIMIDRTRIGQIFSAAGAYQPGVAFFADADDLHFKFALQNGADGIADEYGMVLRGEYRIHDGASEREGALGAEGVDATIGLGYFKDGSQIGGEDFGSAVALDGYLTVDRFSAHGEILDMDEELATKAVGNASADATAFAGTVGYLFTDQVEGALRYQDLDNDAGTTLTTVGVNYYVMGHNAKWQLNFSQFDEDDDDGTIVQVGFAVGTTPTLCCSRNR